MSRKSNFEDIMNEVEKQEVKETPIERPIDMPIQPIEEEEDIYYPHIDIMEENHISKSELPKELQLMILDFNTKESSLGKKGKKELQKLSTQIAEQLIDYNEQQKIKGIDEEGNEVNEDNNENAENIVDEGKEKDDSIWGEFLGGIFNW